MHLLAIVKLRPTPPVLREEIMILMSFCLPNCSICLSREMGDTLPVICMDVVSYVTRFFFLTLTYNCVFPALFLTHELKKSDGLQELNEDHDLNVLILFHPVCDEFPNRCGFRRWHAIANPRNPILLILTGLIPLII
jgi:hypothetical protein